MMRILGIVICFLCISFYGQAQEQSEKTEREKNKVDIFNSEERDNLQAWFYEQTKAMGLSQAKMDEYYSIILYYVVKMKRLDDKDVGYSDDEIQLKFKDLLDKQNKEVRKLLNDDQYKSYIESFKTIIKSIDNKKAMLKH